MHLCRNNKAKIKFNDNKKSFVQSRIEWQTIPFIKQRIRWAADAKVMWKYNKQIFIIFLATFCTNLLLLIAPILYFFIENDKFKIIYILYIIKFILELIVYSIGSVKLKNSFNIINFIIWYILEIPYVVIVGIGSFFSKNIKWRGQISPE